MRIHKFLRNIKISMCGIISTIVVFMNVNIVNASDYDGNWQDKKFEFLYNGDGGERITEYRKKYNNTPVYVKMKSIDAHVKVVGEKCNFSGYYSCEPGQEMFIRSRAGSGSKVAISVSPHCYTKCTVSGVWSPDSINYK